MVIAAWDFCLTIDISGFMGLAQMETSEGSFNLLDYGSFALPLCISFSQLFSFASAGKPVPGTGSG
jgi:hypothetical protein